MLGSYTEKTIADLFVQAIPRQPFCGNDLSFGVVQLPKATALKHQNIQISHSHCHSWLALDVDKADAAFLPDDLGCDAAPTLSVVNPANGHAHLLWALKRPVYKTDEKALAFFADVRSAYTAFFDADASYRAFLTKNPFNAKWRVLQPIREQQAKVYELEDLVEGLPVGMGELKKLYQTKKKAKASMASIAEEGRNCRLFDEVRFWAYANVHHYRKGGNWQQAVFNVASLLNSRFSTPLPEREVRSVAKSVAKYTYPNSPYDKACAARFTKRQSNRGKLSGQARRLASEEKRTTARLLKAKGYSLAAIAEELGASKSSIQRWLKDNDSNDNTF